MALLLAAGAMGAQPEFALQPAVPFQQREGLGNVLTRLENGGPVKVAYLGGSITAAAGWRVKTRQWLADHYPQAQVEEIHAAIGGTGSDLGVYRVQKDALAFEPDLLFVEFSVNDGGAAPEAIWRGMEGIVRQTWAALPECDICFVYTFRTGYEKDLREGLCPSAASADEMLAAHYGIPSINMALPVVEMERAGKLVFQAPEGSQDAEGRIIFSHDGVHPIDAGHQIYTEAVAEALTAWKAGAKPVNHASKLDGPSFVEDPWQQAKIVPVTEAMLHGSWQQLPADSGKGKAFGKRLGTIWEATQPGDRLTFRFRGSRVALYDLVGPDGGQVTITVDGVKRDKPVPRFDSYCTYHRISNLKIASDLDPSAEHEVTVEIHPDQPDRTPVAFRLKDPEAELKTDKYQGTRVWVGGLLLLGEWTGP